MRVRACKRTAGRRVRAPAAADRPGFSGRVHRPPGLADGTCLGEPCRCSPWQLLSRVRSNWRAAGRTAAAASRLWELRTAPRAGRAGPARPVRARAHSRRARWLADRRGVSQRGPAGAGPAVARRTAARAGAAAVAGAALGERSRPGRRVRRTADVVRGSRRHLLEPSDNHLRGHRRPDLARSDLRRCGLGGAGDGHARRAVRGLPAASEHTRRSGDPLVQLPQQPARARGVRCRRGVLPGARCHRARLLCRLGVLGRRHDAGRPHVPHRSPRLRPAGRPLHALARAPAGSGDRRPGARGPAAGGGIGSRAVPPAGVGAGPGRGLLRPAWSASAPAGSSCSPSASSSVRVSQAPRRRLATRIDLSPGSR